MPDWASPELLGAVFTFLAIAYSTSRAATQSKAFAPGSKARANRGAESCFRGAVRIAPSLRSPIGLAVPPPASAAEPSSCIKAAIDEG
jgi:hypothetical protein